MPGAKIGVVKVGVGMTGEENPSEKSVNPWRCGGVTKVGVGIGEEL
jgi:hypothetical protein